MAVLSTTTKGKAGFKAVKTGGKNPGLLRAGAQGTKPVARLGAKAGKPLAKAGKPLAKRRARQRVERFGEAARTIGESLATYGPQAAREFGLVEEPKPKRTAPRVAAGIVIGASAVYFLEPEHGREHREKVMQMVS